MGWGGGAHFLALKVAYRCKADALTNLQSWLVPIKIHWLQRQVAMGHVLLLWMSRRVRTSMRWIRAIVSSEPLEIRFLHEFFFQVR